MDDGRLTEWAASEAESLLGPLGDRWRHSLAVARLAEQQAVQMADVDAHVLVAAAYLHDIGYAPTLRQTGHHGIDGARHVRAAGQERLAALVAYHSGATAEASVRGLERELAAFVPEHSATADALTYCDVRTGHDGRHVTFEERMADIAGRYGDGHTVTLAVRRAYAELLSAERTQRRLETSTTRFRR